MYKDMLEKVSAVVKQLNELEDKFEAFDGTDNVELYQLVIRSNRWLTCAQEELQEIISREQQNA